MIITVRELREIERLVEEVRDYYSLSDQEMWGERWSQRPCIFCYKASSPATLLGFDQYRALDSEVTEEGTGPEYMDCSTSHRHLNSNPYIATCVEFGTGTRG